MRLPFGITAKLFAAVLVTNILTAVAVGYGVRSSFDTGFEAYVREREDQRLTRLATTLGAAYREKGSWDFLRGNEALWQELNRSARPEPVGPPPGMRGEGSPSGLRGEGSPSGLRDGPPPGMRGDGPPPGMREGPPRGEGGPRGDGGPGRPPMFGRAPPAVLLDLSGKVIAGNAEPSQATRRKPVVVEGREVAVLGIPVRETAFDFADRRFQEQQSQAVWVVGLAAIVGAALVAWLLARGLLVPVKRIAGATRALADGNYATRVASESGDELGRLVDDFNRLGNALEKNEKARRQFMADVSHELRTPLAVLKGELEAMQDGVRPMDRAALDSLRSEVDRLGRLVSDLHELSLTDVGGLAYRFESVDLASLVQQTVKGAERRLVNHEMRVDLDLPRAPLQARGDAQRLQQLAANLVENTLRYTDAGGRLRIALHRDGRFAVLTWEDSAPGVPAESLPYLFERLYRVEDSRNRVLGGSGLGLSICESIVHAHGGTIEAAASSLGGLAITVRLPLSEGT
ncbi:hypothetical protein BWI17_17130 [Betaproteobacteria bacterium GR16-43]|nr:hypothetical protein BWI17_17130 [Betaproteobacteria bacterium GR16-43]